MAAAKIEKYLEAFQGNAYPAMIDDLANHLGVTSDSIRKIAPGWAPVVEFKKGKNFMGWWAIPERDAEGRPIGISLRSQNDMKVMFPGSKHGLIYAVNPDHELGDKGYEPGAGNWIRTMDAATPCPVCGKPDGCLLSAENPADPKAVVCIRVNSPRKLRMGYLHIRKSEGIVSGRSALADNAGPVLVVEGFSDTASGLDLGYDSVGRPSNLACMDLLCDLLRGRSVYIIGENDLKPNGQHPGKEGMIAAFQTIKRTCHNVKMVMPPKHVKDLRAWKSKYGLTREQFEAYVEEHGQTHAENLVIEDSRPTTIARAFLNSTCRMAGRYTIKRWGQQWYKYRNGKYVRIEDEAFRKPIYRWAADKIVQNISPDGKVSLLPLVANITTVSNIEEGVMSETLVEDPHIPSWINDATGPDPQNLIVFANGILDVQRFMDGMDDCLLDPTPDLFTTAALPFDFDPTATCHEWKKFLRTSLGDDDAKIRLLREWFGYCMTTDNSQQKMMFMRGPTGAGKGVCLRVLTDLIGKEQTAATSFTDLSGPFGLQPLIGKMACVIGDARTPRNGDVMRGLELLLNIVGNDAVSVNRKHKEQIDLSNLMVRISIASNEFLDLPDHANALLRRLLILEFIHSHVGHEDRFLERKLAAETPGIAVWALQGLRRLRDQGGFTMPASTLEAMAEWRVATNPLSAFVEECCDVVAGEVGKQELFDAWSAWSMERRIRPITKSRFFERMRSACPSSTTTTYEQGVHKMSVYRGVKLKAWAARKFTGRPS